MSLQLKLNSVLILGIVCFSIMVSQPKPPKGMVYVSGGEYKFIQMNRWREGLNNEKLEINPLGQFYVTEKRVVLEPFFIDKCEVTNEQFKMFLDESKYEPKFKDNFLKHWRDGSYPEGQAKLPVVWIDLDDARAYAKWNKKVLPTEEQWQFVAQGKEGRLYPWGNQYDPTRANVGTDGPMPVGSFPNGAGPFGCLDLVGNVWEMTESQEDDGRHWFSYLRGGSWFQPHGSVWYTDNGLMTNLQRLKFWWSSPGLNRSATIGFRCVKEIDE